MNEHKPAAQDFFLNFGITVTLYAVVVSFLSLFFDVINSVFPDNLYNYSDPYSSGVRLAIATLIIVFPLFVWISRIVTKIMQADQSRREVAVRRWLVYITLFLSSAALVVDLVTLLNTFLSGEVSTRFILKVLAVIVVAGIVFWYYLGEVRGRGSEKRFKQAIVISSVLIIALIVWAFAVFGSPATTRSLRADDIRVSVLHSIQWQVVNFWQQKGTLPDTIESLADPISNFYPPVDPETGKAFGYKKTGIKSFDLCADFTLQSQPGRNSPNYAYPTNVPMKPGTDSWSHAVGNVCFNRTIDADMYPVRPKGI